MSIDYKRVHFDGLAAGKPHTDSVCYIVYSGRQIVFTILKNADKPPLMSTGENIESIVAAIAKREGINPKDYTFYELETCIGWSAALKPGEYNFTRITFTWVGEAMTNPRWQAGLCSDRVLKEFWGYIVGKDTGAKLYNFHGGAKTIPYPMIDPQYTIESLYDTVSLFGRVYDKNDFPYLYDATLQRFVDEVCRTLCREMKVPDDNIVEVMSSRTNETMLPPVTSAALGNFLEGLTFQNREFFEALKFPLFEEIV